MYFNMDMVDVRTASTFIPQELWDNFVLELTDEAKQKLEEEKKYNPFGFSRSIEAIKKENGLRK